jgi:CubicO group peptidase (beta-lactamase class C family)
MVGVPRPLDPAEDAPRGLHEARSVLSGPDLAAAARDAAGYADEWLAFRREWLRIPGVQAAVWADGDLALSVAHGHADLAAGVALTPGHLFRVASHSKTFTATAIVGLAEAGRLRLDDRLDRHLPWTAEAGIGDRTPADLLGHGGGVLRDGADADHWQLARPFPDAEGLRTLAADGAVHGADERFKYSNVAFGLLGAVIAAVTGRSYRDHVAEAIVAPLGLTDTAPDLVAGRLADYARGYTARGYGERRIPIELVDTGALDAATGFTSTAADLARWGAAHLPGDERLLGAAWGRRMRRPGFDVDEHDADAGRYALGFELRTVHGRRAFGHGGSYPGHATRLTVLPEDRLSVAVCTNAVDARARPLADGLVALAALAAAEPDGAPVDASVDRYQGRYATLFGVQDIVRLGRRLLVLDPAADDPTEGHVALEPDGPDTFRVVRSPGYGAYGERVRFTLDDGGRVASARLPGGVTAWPVERMAAFVAGRDEVRLGDLASGLRPAGDGLGGAG